MAVVASRSRRSMRRLIALINAELQINITSAQNAGRQAPPKSIAHFDILPRAGDLPASFGGYPNLDRVLVLGHIALRNLPFVSIGDQFAIDLLVADWIEVESSAWVGDASDQRRNRGTLHQLQFLPTLLRGFRRSGHDDHGDRVLIKLGT